MDEHDGQQTQVPDGPIAPTLAQEVRTADALYASGRRRRRGTALVAAGAALTLGLFAGAVAWSEGSGTAVAETETATVDESAAAATTLDGPPTGWPGPDGGGPGAGAGTGTQSPPDTTTVESTAASAAQQVGLVTIVTTLGYQDASAAGTGIVLTADGVILTNNHVISGATTVEVTVESTGEVYTAEVVGTDATADVAVLQLDDAAGLATAAIDDDGGAAVGQAIAAVGNADGGGDLLAAAGTVTALAETITTQSEGTTAGHTLTDLIEIDADVVAGDSGGAVLDAEGEVVGMTTAASSGSAAITGYAIAIDDALATADLIRSGVDTDTITIGLPGFLGVQIGSTDTSETSGWGGAPAMGSARGGVTTAPEVTASAGAAVAGVFADTPAAAAGLVAGDTITALGGITVDSADTLAALLSGYTPGDQVDVTWTSSATGTTQTATITLIAGPAD
ncbi:S1C family serine protease [Pengzhenrongella frigida]|uniref:PDZ domain-containing protein n=1 Tax=Pengzhenrongella frigida TaxID=1259133 RepID=A0A4V1ZHD7_9MICO|nr:trypsin-like peptidase domain-containing protein [Cellulomonas sp. HLT2-17]RYV51684.1 PDZ domain-containing protein [Cellulomonas sp. HLT2-17]